jgi:hypothetical protein
MGDCPEEQCPDFRLSLETLFDEAIALPPEERASFIELKCAHAPHLRLRLLRLLAAHEDSD